MMSPGDRRAARVLVLLLAAGLFVRWTVSEEVPAGGVAYAVRPQERPARDSVLARSASLGRPLARGEKIEINHADASTLERLPGVGPALAGRIVRDREARGDFLNLDDLQRVSGLGGLMAARLAPHTSFRPAGKSRVVLTRRPPDRIRLNGSSAEELTSLPGLGPARAAAIVAFRDRHGPFGSVEDLTKVPGIGPGTIERLRPRVRIP